MRRRHGSTIGSRGRGPARRGIGVMTATVLLGALAACSGTAGAGGPAATTPPASTAPAATSAPPTSAPADAGLSGTWSGRYSGAYHGHFTLIWHQSGSRLGGTIKISDPPQTLAIHGRVTGDAIRFGTVGSAAITYEGTVSGDSMSGTYQVHAGGGSAGGPWSASKSS